jgi:hypothetical protein
MARKVKPEYFNTQEARTMTGLSEGVWRRKAASGAIESVRVGKRLLIPVEEIRRILAAGTVPRKLEPGEEAA